MAQFTAYSLINHRALGDGLRELSSTAGTLAGDCRWSSALEKHWTVKNETLTWQDRTEWVMMSHLSERNLTSCGRLWNADADEQVRAGASLTFILRWLRGVALIGLLEAFVGNARELLSNKSSLSGLTERLSELTLRLPDRLYIVVNLGIRMHRPRWIPEPNVPTIRYVPPLLAAFVSTFTPRLSLPLY